MSLCFKLCQYNRNPIVMNLYGLLINVVVMLLIYLLMLFLKLVNLLRITKSILQLFWGVIVQNLYKSRLYVFHLTLVTNIKCTYFWGASVQSLYISVFLHRKFSFLGCVWVLAIQKIAPCECNQFINAVCNPIYDYLYREFLPFLRCVSALKA